MTIKEIHDTVLFITNKEQNQILSHEEIDLLLDRAQIVLFNQYHTNPKIPAQAQAAMYGESQRIDDSLSAFKASSSFTSSSSGYITLPSNYMHLIALNTSLYNNNLGRNVISAVQVLNEEELIGRLESQVIPVTDSDPVCIMTNTNKILLFPSVEHSGTLYYFRRPTAPKFGYSQTGRTITYNPNDYNSSTQPTGSIQMEWRDYDIMNIISIALSYIGITSNSADLTRFAELKIQQGQ